MKQLKPPTHEKRNSQPNRLFLPRLHSPGRSSPRWWASLPPEAVPLRPYGALANSWPPKVFENTKTLGRLIIFEKRSVLTCFDPQSVQGPGIFFLIPAKRRKPKQVHGSNVQTPVLQFIKKYSVCCLAEGRKTINTAVSLDTRKNISTINNKQNFLFCCFQNNQPTGLMFFP